MSNISDQIFGYTKRILKKITGHLNIQGTRKALGYLSTRRILGNLSTQRKLDHLRHPGTLKLKALGHLETWKSGRLGHSRHSKQGTQALEHSRYFIHQTK